MVEATHHDYRNLISKVLAYGYHVSVFIMLAGMIIYLINPDTGLAVLVMKTGLFTLLITPLLRVLTSIFVFYYIEQDRKYALISLVVFIILSFSILLGRAV